MCYIVKCAGKVCIKKISFIRLYNFRVTMWLWNKITRIWNGVVVEKRTEIGWISELAWNVHMTPCPMGRVSEEIVDPRRLHKELKVLNKIIVLILWIWKVCVLLLCYCRPNFLYYACNLHSSGVVACTFPFVQLRWLWNSPRLWENLTTFLLWRACT